MMPPEFSIGAHAAVKHLPILARDSRCFDTDFNGLEIVAPDAH